MAVIPGMGGTPDRPPGYTPPDQPGVAAGSPNIIRARQVIIIGTGGELLIYSPTQAAGNLIAAGAGSNGTDQFGNTFFQGLQSINGNTVALLESGALFLQSAAGQITGGYAGEVSSVTATPGEVFVSSGGQSALDPTSQILLQSGNNAGGTQQATLNGNVTVNINLTVGGNLTVTGTGSSIGGSTSVGAADNGGVTSGPSGTVNSFPAAGPNHTHAMAHHHPYHS